MNPANIVPLSDSGWLVVLAVTVVLCVVWLAVVVVLTRRHTALSPGHDVQTHPQEPGGLARVSARVLLLVVVLGAVAALVAFLVGRAVDLAA